MWGFAAKSIIQKLFIAQKKGVRTTAPGFMQYVYKDGLIPTHTKSSFKDYLYMIRLTNILFFCINLYVWILKNIILLLN